MKTIIVLIMSILITGCATSYQSSGMTGGFSETQLDKNVFTVRFAGNGYTSKERATDFTLLRSAELSLKHGYSHFRIIQNDSYSKLSAHTTPRTYQTYGSIRSYGNTAYGSATTHAYGGDTYIISRPNTSNTIVCFKKKPKGFSYNATFIKTSLKAKYHLNKESKKNSS